MSVKLFLKQLLAALHELRCLSWPRVTGCANLNPAEQLKSVTPASQQWPGSTQLLGSTGCTPCQVGTHQPDAGQTICIDCGVGKHANGTSSTACDVLMTRRPLPSGTTSVRSGSSSGGGSGVPGFATQPRAVPRLPALSEGSAETN